MTLSGATTLGQSGHGSDGSEGVLYVPFKVPALLEPHHHIGQMVRAQNRICPGEKDAKNSLRL